MRSTRGYCPPDTPTPTGTANVSAPASAAVKALSSTSETPPGKKAPRIGGYSCARTSLPQSLRSPVGTAQPSAESSETAGTRRPLENHTKNQTMRATGAHVSILACVTPDELRRKLTATEAANGFANRFLYVTVHRSKLLPRGGAIPETITSEHATVLRERAAAARKVGRLDFTEQAGQLWDHAYEHELSIERHGMVGAVTSRAEAHTLRLSMLFALLDRKKEIDKQHVEAALSLWRYCESSVSDIWGDSLGDPVADAILQAIREQGELSRTAVRDLFSRHRGADYERALADLVTARRVIVRTVETSGRPTTLYALPAT